MTSSPMYVPSRNSSEILLRQTVNDYSSYLFTDLSTQTANLEDFILECIAKLEELLSLFLLKKEENESWQTTVLPNLIKSGNSILVDFNSRLDSFQVLIHSFKVTLEDLEAKICVAEASLGLQSPMKSLLKYFVKSEIPQMDSIQPIIHETHLQQFFQQP